MHTHNLHAHTHTLHSGILYYAQACLGSDNTVTYTEFVNSTSLSLLAQIKLSERVAENMCMLAHIEHFHYTSEKEVLT